MNEELAVRLYGTVIKFKNPDRPDRLTTPPYTIQLPLEKDLEKPAVPDFIVQALLQEAKTFGLAYSCIAAQTGVINRLKERGKNNLVEIEQKEDHTVISGPSIGKLQKTIVFLDAFRGKEDALLSSLDSARCEVSDIVALIDAAPGKKKSYKERGYNIYTLFHIRGLVRYYTANEVLTDRQYSELIEYITRMVCDVKR